MRRLEGIGDVYPRQRRLSYFENISLWVRPLVLGSNIPYVLLFKLANQVTELHLPIHWNILNWPSENYDSGSTKRIYFYVADYIFSVVVC